MSDDAIAVYEAAEARMLELTERFWKEWDGGRCCGCPPSRLDLELRQARQAHFAARAALEADVPDAGDLDEPAVSSVGSVDYAMLDIPAELERIKQRATAPGCRGLSEVDRARFERLSATLRRLDEATR